MSATARPSITVLMIMLFAASAQGGDWPQILGPNRDSRAVGEPDLAAAWPADGLKTLWSFDVGAGYAGPVVVGGKSFVYDRSGARERLTAISEQGEQLWQAEWPATYRSSMDPDSGPRCVPTVAGDRVLCYGAAGDLTAVSLADGKVLWSKPLRKELKADDGYFGAGSSPIVVGSVIIANIGGKLGGIVGVDLATGKVLWKATDYEASYASPIAVTIDGKPAAIVVTRLRTVLIDAMSGTVLSEINFGARGPTVNAATPLDLGKDRYFLTASYNIGAVLLERKEDKLTVLKKHGELLSSQYNSPVLVGTRVIGCDGREDFGPCKVKAFDPVSGEEFWQFDVPTTTHLIAVGTRVLALSSNGDLRLIDGTDSQGKVLAQVQLDPGVYRSLPAYSNRVLYVRRTSEPGRSGTLFALAIP